MGRGYTVYVGRLSSRTRERDLDDLFSRYGRIDRIDLKSSKGYAFIVHYFISLFDTLRSSTMIGMRTTLFMLLMARTLTVHEYWFSMHVVVNVLRGLR